MNREIIGDIWSSSECYKNLQVLCDEIGSRFSGSRGERQARDFILGKFKEYGLDRVYVEEFKYASWQRGEAKLKILEPAKKQIKILSLSNVASTNSEGITGEIISIGNGAPKDFERHKDKISGKIVLVFAGDQFVKTCRAAQLRAKAILLMGKNYGGIQITGGSCLYNKKMAEIPAVSISKEDGLYIERLLAEYPRVKVNLYLKNTIKNKTSWNIIGEIRGRGKPGEEVIVGAHYDSADVVCPGAVDNASGTVVVMELARVFSKQKGKFRRTIKFICFSGEEIGLRGSNAYVKQHAKDLEKIVLMLNIDPAGRVIGYRVEGFSSLVSYMKNLARKIGFSIWAKRFIDYNQDSFPFMLNGVPAVWLHTQPRLFPKAGFGHTPMDTVDKVDIYELKEALTVAAYTLLDIVNVNKRPEEHKSQNEVKKWLEEDSDIVEILKVIKLGPFVNKRSTKNV